MPTFHPGDPEAPDSESIDDRPEDRRTLEVRGGALSVPIDAGADVDAEDRETVPPPLPVAEYVQTMMQQAETHDRVPSDPPPSRAPVSWRGEPPSSRAPVSWRGEPPSSRAPVSWRGEPRAPVSFRPRAPLDSAGGLASLRAVEPEGSGADDGFSVGPKSRRAGFGADDGVFGAGEPRQAPSGVDDVNAAAPRSRLPPVSGAPKDRAPPTSSQPSYSSSVQRLQAEDEEFQRRPLSLRSADGPRSPPELDAWALDLDDASAAPSRSGRAADSAPAPAPAPPSRLPRSTPSPGARPPEIDAAHAARVAAHHAAAQLAMPKQSVTAPATSPTLPGFPRQPASPPVHKTLPPASSGAASVRSAAPASVRSASPPSVQRGASTPKGHGSVTSPPSASPITRPLATPSPVKIEDDDEMDALPFDDLVAASYRPPGPRTLAAPIPTPVPKGPVPAGLRLGKEPLNSFPAITDELADEEASGDLPPILDVAWARGNLDDAPLDDQRDALLPWGDPRAEPASTSPEEPEIPAVLGAGLVTSASPGAAIGLADDLPFEDDLEPVDEIQARFDEGDFAGALLLAERILAQDPSDARARSAVEDARERLIEEYKAELGGRRQIPHIAMTSEEIRWLSLDHRAGFLLSCVDGHMTVEELLDVSCMPELDALRIIVDLRERCVISFEVDQARSTRR